MKYTTLDAIERRLSMGAQIDGPLEKPGQNIIPQEVVLQVAGALEAAVDSRLRRRGVVLPLKGEDPLQLAGGPYEGLRTYRHLAEFVEEHTSRFFMIKDYLSPTAQEDTRGNAYWVPEAAWKAFDKYAWPNEEIESYAAQTAEANRRSKLSRIERTGTEEVKL